MLLAQDVKPRLTDAEAAEALGVSAEVLRKMRSRGKGPAFFRIGRAVRYDPADIAAYLGRHRVAPANEVRA